jgi:hypothetical protein
VSSVRIETSEGNTKIRSNSSDVLFLCVLEDECESSFITN